MKNTIGIALFFFLISLTHSCKETEVPQMKQVLAIHDEVMPKMGTMGNLVSDLDQKIENAPNAKELIAARQDLKAAHKAMMDWMRDFGNRFDGDEILKGKALSPEKQEWLNEEEIKVKALREKINASIQKAEEVLKQP